jgi:hypothetical protein
MGKGEDFGKREHRDTMTRRKVMREFEDMRIE